MIGLRRITRYRTRFANGGLKRELDKCGNSVGLYMLVAEYKEISHEESRVFRLLGAEQIIKDYKQIIRYVRKRIKNEDNINELLNYKCILEQLEKELEKKVNKSNGGYKADKTKKEPVKMKSKWYELPIHGFSCNYMYSVRNGRMVKSEAYNRWIDHFPWMLTPDEYDLLEQGVDIEKPVGIEMEFIAKAEFDCDNFSKSFIDTMFGDVDDNIVHETVCRRIGTCDYYNDGMIRFRFYNV